MKKIIALLMTLVLLASVMATLSSCNEHEHEFETEWSSDANYHWYMCNGENCLEVSEKAAHEWTEKDGAIVCGVCGASAEDATPDEQVWEAAIAEQKFENVTIAYTVNVISLVSYEDGDPVTQDVEGVIQEHLIKVTEDCVYRFMSVLMPGSDKASENEMNFEGEQAEIQRTLFFETFFALLSEKDNFVYDATEGVYIAPATVTVTIPQGESMSAEETMRNGKLKIDANGNIEYFSCTLTEKVFMDGSISADTTADVVWTFSDYGTTVIAE